MECEERGSSEGKGHDDERQEDHVAGATGRLRRGAAFSGVGGSRAAGHFEGSDGRLFIAHLVDDGCKCEGCSSSAHDDTK